jgi:two-component system chemotaxis sensor kinase CheA
MDFSQDDEIIAIFIEESRDHLAEIEDGILKLENESAEMNPELVHQMFRAAHSIKAGANLLNLSNIEKLSHLLENILQQLRFGEQQTDSDLVTKFLLGVDKIGELIDNLSFSDLSNISLLVDQLTTIANRLNDAETKNSDC